MQRDQRNRPSGDRNDGDDADRRNESLSPPI
jgi:hypothetical protein